MSIHCLFRFSFQILSRRLSWQNPKTLFPAIRRFSFLFSMCARFFSARFLSFSLVFQKNAKNLLRFNLLCGSFSAFNGALGVFSNALRQIFNMRASKLKHIFAHFPKISSRFLVRSEKFKWNFIYTYNYVLSYFIWFWTEVKLVVIQFHLHILFLLISGIIFWFDLVVYNIPFSGGNRLQFTVFNVRICTQFLCMSMEKSVELYRFVIEIRTFNHWTSLWCSIWTKCEYCMSYVRGQFYSRLCFFF